MTIKVFFTISNFRSRKTSSGQFDFSFENPPENACRIPKRFCSAIIEKFCVFFEKSLKAFRRRRIQPGQAWWTNFPKVEFFRSKCQIDMKKRCFFKKKFKKVNGHITWSVVLTTMRKIARQNSGKFLGEVRKNL